MVTHYKQLSEVVLTSTHNLCLKEYTHKDYLSFQMKGVGETNIFATNFMKIGRAIS